MNFGKVALLALASASMVFLSSCKDDPKKKPAPTVQVQATGNKALDGKAKEEHFPLIVIAKPADGLKISSIKLTVTYKGTDGADASSPEKTLSTTANKDLGGYTASIALTEIPAGVKAGKLNLVVTDSDKNVAKTSVEFDFSGVTPPPADKGWEAEKTGAFSHSNGTAMGGYDLKNNAAVSLTDASKKANRYMMNTSAEDKAFTPAWTSEKVTSISPNPEGNGTLFQKVELNFADVTVADAEAAFKEASASKNVTGVAKDQVYLAKLGEEFYIIKITEVSTTENARKGTDKGHIAFTYKAKKK
jgi:lipoprotein